MSIRRWKWARLWRKDEQHGHQLPRADPSDSSHRKQRIVAQATVMQIFPSVLLTGMPIHSRSVAFGGREWTSEALDTGNAPAHTSGKCLADLFSHINWQNKLPRSENKSGGGMYRAVALEILGGARSAAWFLVGHSGSSWNFAADVRETEKSSTLSAEAPTEPTDRQLSTTTTVRRSDSVEKELTELAPHQFCGARVILTIPKNLRASLPRGSPVEFVTFTKKELLRSTSCSCPAWASTAIKLHKNWGYCGQRFVCAGRSAVQYPVLLHSSK
ncbi:hypothetical protein BDZ45DRAFT_752587 [Acephala macrosclerotiorum]|nr:hypothetical protein BDZ45DRAFT_752587 [Acephala macrosclerotiorum]